MIIDAIFALYGLACLLITLPGVYFSWKTETKHPMGTRWFQQWIIPSGAFLLLLGGWWASHELGKKTDIEERGFLIDNVSSVALTLNPDRIKALSFTADDKYLPEFQRIKKQMKAAAKATQLNYIFSVTQKNEQFIFGPESIDENAPLASPPGTIYEFPPEELTTVFQEGNPQTTGLYTDEYGSFITALVPVLDPITNEVILVIGADVQAKTWNAMILRERALPLFLSLTLIALLVVGNGLLSWRHTLSLKRQLRWQYIEVILSAITGLALTFAIAWLLYGSEQRSRYHSYAALARTHASAVTESVSVMRNRLKSLGSLFENTDTLNLQEFQSFTEVLAHDGLSQSWGWAPIIPANALDSCIEEAKSQGLEDFVIWERNDKQEPIPVSNRKAYYPVLYVAPEQGNDMVYGFDAGSEPMRLEALQETITSGLATSTEPLVLVQESGTNKGVVVFEPVYNKDSLEGFAVLTLIFRPMLHRAITQAGIQDSGITVDLFQITPDGTPVFLASSISENTDANYFDHHNKNDLCVKVPLCVFGKSYALAMHPKASWVEANPLWMGKTALIIGLLSTLVLTAFAFSLTKRRASLAHEVAQRTEALAESKRQLLNERTKLQRILDNLPEGIFLVTADYDIRYMNSAMKTIVDENQGKKCYECMHGFSEPCSWCVNDRVFAGETVKRECDVCKKGHIYDVFDMPIQDSDGALCKLSVFSDITEVRHSQEALRLSEARMAATLNSIGDGVISTDIKGNIVGLNVAASHLTGWKPEESIDHSISEVFDITNGQTGEPAVNPVWKTIKEGVVVELENHTILTGKNGEKRHIADSCAPIRTSDGNVIGAVLVFRDVTEEYRTRRELAESNDRFKQTAAQSREIIWEVDSNEIYTYVSAAVTDILGYQPEDLIGKIHYYDHHTEEGREEFIATTKDFLKKPRQFKEFEHQMMHKDGHTVTLLANGLPILDNEGNVIGYRGSSQDITERKRMETELIESREHLANILNSVEDVIWSASPPPQIKLLYMTPASIKIYGRPVEDFYDTPGLWREMVVEEDKQKVADIWNTLEKSGSLDVEYRIKRPDDSICWVRDRRQCIYDQHNNIIRIDGILSDITTLKLVEQALKESEATYRVIFEGSRDALVLIDSDLKFTAGNSAALSMFKIETLQKFKTLGPVEVSPDIQPDGTPSTVVAEKIIGITLKEGAHYFEWTHKRSDETEFPAIVLLNKITLNNRILYQATIRDITKEKEAEQELQRSREQYMLAVNGANDGIFDWDIQGNRLYLSPNWKQMIGYHENELPDTFETFEERIHPKDKTRVAENLDKYLKGLIKNYAIEFRFRHKDGHYLWILARGEALRDKNGIPYRMAGSHSDITERKEAEQKLRESEARINTVLNAAQDAIIMLDSNGNISVWNAAAERIFGYHREEILGKNMHELLAPPHYIEAHQKAFPFFQKTGTGPAVGKLLELSALDNNRREFPIELSLSAVQIREEWNSVGIIRDITNRKKAEQELMQANKRLEDAITLANEMAANAEMANAAKSAFLANVSHEIRTPLNGIIGMTSLLLDTKLTEQQQHNAEIIQESGESLLWLINDILDFSKIEAGKLEIETINFDLHSLISDFSMILAVKAQQKHLEFVCSADPNTPDLLVGDPGRLRQILTNLAGNAIKFTHDGEVVVRVSLVDENKEGALLHFSVRDTGIGIPEDKQALLFNSFTQLDASTTRKYGGTGLGLAITKQLVELMNGTIGVISSEGKGSEFWFEIRLPARHEEGYTLAPSVDLRGVRALVVDDNATNREMICAQLQALGIIPNEAPNGTVALKMLKTAYESKQPYNLAILDMLMPGLDGESLGREIYSNEHLQNISMVMMTSIGRRGDARRLEEIGFAAYLTKPVRKTELFDCLSIAMGHKQTPKPEGQKHPIVTRHSVRELRKYHARILLAEDNIVNQQVALGVLKKFHVSVEVANNGLEAVKAIEHGNFDLVLMDVQMPEMDGLEATQTIRKSLSLESIPIIAMTAHASKEDKTRCIEAGMNDFLTKPLNPEMLFEMLKNWLPEKKKMKQNDIIPKIETNKTSDTMLFDKEGMLARVMGDENLAIILINTFLNDIPCQMDTLRQHLEADDCVAATRQSHTIKGAAANVGAMMLSQIAAEMESAGKSANLDEMKALLPRLEKQFKLTEQAMEMS